MDFFGIFAIFTGFKLAILVGLVQTNSKIWEFISVFETFSLGFDVFRFSPLFTVMYHSRISDGGRWRQESCGDGTHVFSSLRPTKKKLVEGTSGGNNDRVLPSFQLASRVKT